jgi:hypothetical protein
MATRMQQRRGTAADWAAQNPILAAGEIGFETDTKVIKLGDGATPWASLGTPYLTAAGGTITGALSVPAPTANAHAARKQDVDSKLSLSGGSMTGTLTLLAPTAPSHAARKSDVDSKLSLTGGTISGSLTVPAPTSSAHAARKEDVDSRLPLSGGVITGNLLVQGTLISNSEPHIFVQSGEPLGAKTNDLWGW